MIVFLAEKRKSARAFPAESCSVAERLLSSSHGMKARESTLIGSGSAETSSTVIASEAAKLGYDSGNGAAIGYFNDLKPF